MRKTGSVKAAYVSKLEILKCIRIDQLVISKLLVQRYYTKDGVNLQRKLKPGLQRVDGIRSEINSILLETAVVERCGSCVINENACYAISCCLMFCINLSLGRSEYINA